MQLVSTSSTVQCYEHKIIDTLALRALRHKMRREKTSRTSNVSLGKGKKKKNWYFIDIHLKWAQATSNRIKTNGIQMDIWRPHRQYQTHRRSFIQRIAMQYDSFREPSISCIHCTSPQPTTTTTSAANKSCGTLFRYKFCLDSVALCE